MGMAMVVEVLERSRKSRARDSNIDVQKVTLKLQSSQYDLFTLSITRFTPSTDIAGQTPVKSSVQRAVRASVLSQWKIEPETLEAIWPKKDGLVLVKW